MGLPRCRAQPGPLRVWRGRAGLRGSAGLEDRGNDPGLPDARLGRPLAGAIVERGALSHGSGRTKAALSARAGLPSDSEFKK